MVELGAGDRSNFLGFQVFRYRYNESDEIVDKRLLGRIFPRKFQSLAIAERE